MYFIAPQCLHWDREFLFIFLLFHDEFKFLFISISVRRMQLAPRVVMAKGAMKMVETSDEFWH